MSVARPETPRRELAFKRSIGERVRFRDGTGWLGRLGVASSNILRYTIVYTVGFSGPRQSRQSILHLVLGSHQLRILGTSPYAEGRCPYLRPGGGGGGNENSPPAPPPPAPPPEPASPSKLPAPAPAPDLDAAPTFLPSRPGIEILNVCPSFRE